MAAPVLSGGRHLANPVGSVQAQEFRSVRASDWRESPGKGAGKKV